MYAIRSYYEAGARLFRPETAFEQPHVLFRGDDFARFFGDRGGDNDFDELVIDDGLGGRAVEFPVDGDDAAESRFGVGGKSPLVSFEQILAEGHAAGVGVFDDNAGRTFVELLDAFKSTVGIADVVVGNRITSYNVCYTKLLRAAYSCWCYCSP